MSIDEVIDMVTVGYSFVPTTWSMYMPGFMASAAVVWRTGIRVCS